MDYLGEVIESDTRGFTAEAKELYGAPDFGSLVKVEYDGFTCYGIVYDVKTQGRDISRKPVAFGKTEEELMEEQPQVYALLGTWFSVLIIGYKRDGEYKGYLPPKPPKIHSFVYNCTKGEIDEVSNNLNFLKTVLSDESLLGDELVAASLRFMAQFKEDKTRFLIDAGKELVRLLKSEFDRYINIRRRIF